MSIFRSILYFIWNKLRFHKINDKSYDEKCIFKLKRVLASPYSSKLDMEAAINDYENRIILILH